MPEARGRPPPGQEHVRAGHAVPDLRLRPRARPQSDRADLSEEDREGHRRQHHAVRRRLRLGRGEPGPCLPHPGHAGHRAAGRSQRQSGAGPGRAGLGHRDLRHVPHHAGHVGLALPERGLRVRRRRGAPGGGRDRGLRLCRRGLVRRQVRRHHHLGARLLPQAGGHRAGGDGRDPAGGHQRPARRAQHRPAHQGRAGRPAGRHLRQPRRRAQSGHGRQLHRGLLLLRSSPPAASPRPSTWWW